MKQIRSNYNTFSNKLENHAFIYIKNKFNYYKSTALKDIKNTMQCMCKSISNQEVKIVLLWIYVSLKIISVY